MQEEPQEDPTARAHRPAFSMPDLLIDKLRDHLRLRREGGRFTLDSREGQSAPVPSGPVRVVGLDPIRILIVGGDYGVGFGTASRAQALDGAIADLVHEHTGRGVTVENRARDQVRLKDLHASLGATGAFTFDLVVWAPTFAEAARYLTYRPWRDGLFCMIEAVRQTSSAGIVLLGIPVLLGVSPLAHVARWRAAHIGRVIQEVADQYSRTYFTQPPPIHIDEIRHISGPDVYRATAAEAVPAMLQALRTHAASGEIDPPRPKTRCSTDLVL